MTLLQDISERLKHIAEEVEQLRLFVGWRLSQADEEAQEEAESPLVSERKAKEFLDTVLETVEDSKDILEGLE